MARNGQKTAIRAGRWRWLPINDDICNSFLKSLWFSYVHINADATDFDSDVINEHLESKSDKINEAFC